MKLLLLLAAAAPLFAQDCSSLSVLPGSIALSASANNGTVAVTVPTGCAWRVSTDSTWLSVPSGQLSGTGTFTWSATANSSPQDRRGVITVTGSATTVTIQVTQPAPACALALDPASANYAVTGGRGSFQVQTTCSWAAGSGYGWITVPSPTGANTGGPVTYTVAANTCATARTGAVTVQVNAVSVPAQFFQITQDGSPDNLSLSQNSAMATATASDGRFDVNTASACSWTAYSSVSWIHVVLGAGGSGNGPVLYHVDENKQDQRTGTIQVGPQTYTVTQQAATATGPQLTVLVNSASYASGAVAPGEIVTLGGVGMGPKDGQKWQWATPEQKAFTKILAGVSVLFDGVPAALTYVSATQINAVAPYSVAGKTTTQAQVQYNGVLSNTLNVPVQAAAPGIYSLDATGAGSGAVLNENYDVNDKFHPAARNSVVMIFCTGGGVTNPASEDAAITTLKADSLPWLTQDVSVTIGGLPANIWYKGGAPGNVAGLTQINAQIPLGVTPGSAVPVVVKIGSWTSQTNITIAVQ
jgi:uncharacterized protein (TIGR03437 family)